jgi:tRNA A37 threonylcarbamoyladenosine dehydratase
MTMRFARTEMLLGKEKIEKLKKSHVTVCGLGAVGSYAVEALARAGVGHLRIVDFDVISESNINRQLFALTSTIQHKKTDVAASRILDINPDCHVEKIHRKIDEYSEHLVLAEPYTVLIDAIDSLSAKVHLMINAIEKNIFVISSMGAAGRLNPDTIYTCDISETHTCPLARFVRRKLHRRNIHSGIRCVFSPETPLYKLNHQNDVGNHPDNDQKKSAPVIGSISYITAIFGLKAAYEAINHILECE